MTDSTNRRPTVHRALALLGAAWVLVATPDPAHALGTLGGPSGLEPVEQRVALAVGPGGTVMWSSARFDAAAGPVGVLVPAPVGASLDWSSAAWLEALEVATAPRVVPPSGVTAECPDDPSPSPFYVAGDLVGETPLAPLSVIVLTDAAAVTLWASQNGLVVPPAVATGLSSLEGGSTRFVASLFDAPSGGGTTPTLRVAIPAGTPSFPLVLTRAGALDLTVTVWAMGEGRAALGPGASTTVDLDGLVFQAAGPASNYEELRAGALFAAGDASTVVEAASHDAFALNLPFAGGDATVDGVVTTYFGRASAYGDGNVDPGPCIAQAAAALGSFSPVAAACARADLGVVEGAASCTEVVQGGEIDPQILRCGPGADDLALALSGLSPSAAWLTRHSLVIPSATTGTTHTVTFGAGAEVSPVIDAAGVDLTGCDGGGGAGGGGEGGQGGSAGTGGAGASPGGGGRVITTSRVPVYFVDEGCSCTGTEVTFVDSYETAETDAPEAYYQEEEDCGGDTETYAEESYANEDCTGDTETYSDESTSEDCSGDSSESSDTSSDSSDDGGCGSDTSDTAEPETSESSGAFARGTRRRPRLSVMTLGLALCLVPLRRLSRRKRRPTRGADDQRG